METQRSERFISSSVSHGDLYGNNDQADKEAVSKLKGIREEQMTYTIEDVKRLVPEARNITKTETAIRFTVSGIRNYTDDPLVSMFLTTRHQLAIARAALEYIDQYNRKAPNPNTFTVGDALNMRGEAGLALDAIAKANK